VRTLHDLSGAGEITCFDLDVIMVAVGYLSYDSVTAYLESKSGDTSPTSDDDVATVAQEIVDRICGCQFQDGGATELLEADDAHVHLRVSGACVGCPQIRYTMRVLDRAIRFRAPQPIEVVIDGTRSGPLDDLPTNNQVTMGMLFKETGLTFRDLDDELRRRSYLVDEDIVRLARLKKLGLLRPVVSCARTAKANSPDEGEGAV
jgi:Fe-S cluster biogenesis protein NfuA